MCQLGCRLRVPSGVMARCIFDAWRNFSITICVRDTPSLRGSTGIPPIERNIGPKGQKNQDDFIRKPAVRPTEEYASLPTMKSQLDVWGATQIMHFGTSGTVISTFQPKRRNKKRDIFMKY